MQSLMIVLILLVTKMRMKQLFSHRLELQQSQFYKTVTSGFSLSHSEYTNNQRNPTWGRKNSKFKLAMKHSYTN